MQLPDQNVSAFLTFNGAAQDAMEFYEATIPGTQIESIVLFGPDDPHGDTGKVLNGLVNIRGQHLMFMDMQAAYPAPPFSWSTSLLLVCSTEEDFDDLFAGLSQDGLVMMGPEPVMDLRTCAWVTDRFGVTWQLIWK